MMYLSDELKERALNQPMKFLSNGEPFPMGSENERAAWRQMQQQNQIEFNKRVVEATTKKTTPAETKLNAYKSNLSVQRLTARAHQQQIAKMEAEILREQEINATKSTQEYKRLAARCEELKTKLPAHLHNDLTLGLLAYEHGNLTDADVTSVFVEARYKFQVETEKKLKELGDLSSASAEQSRVAKEQYDAAHAAYSGSIVTTEVSE